jgi:hypothetical protein
MGGMNMKIEAGKYYRTRDGQVFGPIMRDTSDRNWPWHLCDKIEECWLESGRWYSNDTEHSFDLVAEVYVSDTPPDVSSDDTIVRMNFSEMARKGCKTNSGNLYFFCGMDYIHAHYSVILHWEDGISPPAPPAPQANTTKTARDELVEKAALAILNGHYANPGPTSSYGFAEIWLAAKNFVKARTI